MAWTDEELNRKIGRVIKQCNSDGDEAMTFMAIYSFLEGYMRTKSCKQLQKNLENRFWSNAPASIYDLSFSQVLNTFKFTKNLTGRNSDKPESLFLDEIVAFHGSGSSLSTNTNKIRHEFEELNADDLAVIIWQFVKFAQYNNFSSDKIKNLLESVFIKNWNKSENRKNEENDTVDYEKILNSPDFNEDKQKEIAQLKKRHKKY